jgi:hypothetical protein
MGPRSLPDAGELSSDATSASSASGVVFVLAGAFSRAGGAADETIRAGGASANPVQELTLASRRLWRGPIESSSAKLLKLRELPTHQGGQGGWAKQRLRILPSPELEGQE